MYTYDPDLEFLGRLKSEDLEDLVHLLIYDKDGTKRISEELSQRQSYKDNCPNHHEYWQDIAGELQCFGANTLATILRGGRGVLYREILCDVCDSIKLEYSKDAATEEIEETMFMKLIGDRVGQMSAEEKEELRRQLNLKDTSAITPGILIALQGIFRAGGAASYQLALLAANQLWKTLFGTGLSLAANTGITRSLSVLAGPIGWIITGVWAAIDIASPATRVTKPAVLLIALLRRKPRDDDGGSELPSPKRPLVPVP